MADPYPNCHTQFGKQHSTYQPRLRKCFPTIVPSPRCPRSNSKFAKEKILVKPYLYILGVLLVGGGIGYFIGQRSATLEHWVDNRGIPTATDGQSIQQVLARLSEAYRLHDAMLVFRDCSNSYIEIDAITG